MQLAQIASGIADDLTAAQYLTTTHVFQRVTQLIQAVFDLRMVQVPIPKSGGWPSATTVYHVRMTINNEQHLISFQHLISIINFRLRTKKVAFLDIFIFVQKIEEH